MSDDRLPNGQKNKLHTMCAEWRKKIERLESALAQAHKEGSVVSATGVAIAITIRKDAVDSIEKIIGKAQP